MQEETNLNLTWASLARIAVFAVGAFVLYEARSVVGVLAVAIVVSLGLNPFVKIFERLRVGRLLGTLIVFLIGLLVLSGFVYFVVPVIAVEIGSFAEHLNQSVTDLFGVALPRLAAADLNVWFSDALGFLGGTAFSLTGAIGAVMGRLVLGVATIVITFYLTLAEDGVERLMRAILPDSYEQAALDVFGRFRTKIRHWFMAQLGLSVLVGLVVGFGSWALGLKYPLVLGLIAAVFELVPIVGPIVTGAVAFLLAVSESVTLGLYAVLFFLIVQQIENHLLTPLIMGKTVQVHPLLVILALLVGGMVAGFVGVVLAVPVAVIVQEMFSYFSEQKRRRPTLDI